MSSIHDLSLYGDSTSSVMTRSPVTASKINNIDPVDTATTRNRLERPLMTLKRRSEFAM
ncbi:hypothetical protein Ae717Ps2_6748c [Pseudonocardia sp. Ae717_Ps2]|nr:hypothetical protein Ae717Ps2_6748c [Pseudonocardia sp. Ae717_Ps2]